MLPTQSHWISSAKRCVELRSDINAISLLLSLSAPHSSFSQVAEALYTVPETITPHPVALANHLLSFDPSSARARHYEIRIGQLDRDHFSLLLSSQCFLLIERMRVMAKPGKRSPPTNRRVDLCCFEMGLGE
jgi:hypothetical protein